MKESGYYPPGTEFDPSAPWNEEPELGLYEVTIKVMVAAIDEDDATELRIVAFPEGTNLEFDVENTKLIEVL